MILRVFRGTTLFLAGVGVGSVVTVGLVGYALDEHGDKILEALSDIKDIAKEVADNVPVDEPGEPKVEDIVVEGTVSEVSDFQDGHPSDTAAQKAPEAPEQT